VARTIHLLYGQESSNRNAHLAVSAWFWCFYRPLKNIAELRNDFEVWAIT